MKYLLIVTMFAFASLGLNAQTGSGQTGSGQTGSKTTQSGQSKTKWNKSQTDSTGGMHHNGGGKNMKSKSKTKGSSGQNARDTTM